MSLPKDDVHIVGPSSRPDRVRWQVVIVEACNVIWLPLILRAQCATLSVNACLENLSHTAHQDLNLAGILYLTFISTLSHACDAWVAGRSKTSTNSRLPSRMTNPLIGGALGRFWPRQVLRAPAEWIKPTAYQSMKMTASGPSMACTDPACNSAHAEPHSAHVAYQRMLPAPERRSDHMPGGNPCLQSSLHLARSIRLPGVNGPAVTTLHRCGPSFQACNAVNVHLLTSHAVCCSPRNDLPCPACMPDQLHMCRKSPAGAGHAMGTECSRAPKKVYMWTTRMPVVTVPMLS